MPSVVGQITKGAVFDKLVDVVHVAGTAHRLLYTGVDGVVNELAYGTSGQHLKSEGAATAPTWETPVSAAAVFADNAIVCGDGGARGVQDRSATISDLGVMSVPGIGDGGYTSYDLCVGNVTTPSYGMIQMGNSAIGRTSFKAGAIDLDGAVICRNISGPVTGNIEFIWTESGGGDARFALPRSGVGLATYNSRSMFLAGPAPADTDFVTVSYWQGLGHFPNIVCDTDGTGADLGVQNDIEAGGILYIDDIQESTLDAGVTVEAVLLKDGLVDGVDVAAHAARHTSGADDIQDATTSLKGIAKFNTQTFELISGEVVFGLEDSNRSHRLRLYATSDLNADRALNFATGDATRTLTISGDAAIDQDTTSGSSPTLDGTNFTGIPTAGVVTALKTESKVLYIQEPTSSDDFPIFFTPHAITIVKVWGQTDTGTLTFQLVERTTTSPGSGGTNILTSSMVADATGENTTDFANAAIAADSWVTYDSSAEASAPNKLWIAIEYTIN